MHSYFQAHAQSDVLTLKVSGNQLVISQRLNQCCKKFIVLSLSYQTSIHFAKQCLLIIVFRFSGLLLSLLFLHCKYNQ